MAAESVAHASRDERTPLLEEQGINYHNDNVEPSYQKATTSVLATRNAVSVLPIALFAALGMSATAATSIFAYASLLCKEPTHCQNQERNRYAASVALSVTIANVCSLLVLGPLEKLSRSHRKAGLALWIICRSFSVIMLALGVQSKNIVIALSGRVFEGLASDNLLHFNLNAIYVRVQNSNLVSNFIGISLALFMIGISISPAVVGLFGSFVTSFFVALGIFAFTLFYLAAFVGDQQSEHEPTTTNSPTGVRADSNRNIPLVSRNAWAALAGTMFSPLRPFHARPASLMSGMALFIYNVVQSYMFSLIMVHTSLDFRFSSRQNGQLLSIVHAVSAAYLFLVLFGIPEITRRYRFNEHSELRGKTDAILALISLVMQIISLVGFANATQIWEIYFISGFLALGLATPSFIKAHFLGFFAKDDAANAMGAMTMMETLGGLLSPSVLGLWQTMWPGAGVFYAAAGMMIVATSLFSAAVLALSVNKPPEGGNQSRDHSVEDILHD